MQTRELLVAKGTKRRSGAKLTSVRGVTVHDTGNYSTSAGADNHARLQANNPNAASNSWHWTVDEKEAVRSIPEDEKANHAGKAEGNNTTVGVEICVNKVSEPPKYAAAVANGAELVAAILKRQGFSSAVDRQNIFQHNYWTGKDCPHEIRRGNPYSWAQFLTEVNKHMAGGGISNMYVTTKTATIYRRDSDRKTIGAGHKLELLEYSGGKWALVRNPDTGNEFIVEWAALKQAG